MRAGRLRTRVTVQRSKETTNETGERVDEWETLGEFWADVISLTGREVFTSQTAGSQVQYQVDMRWHPDISAAKRVLVGEKVLDVQAVLDLEERHRTTRLLCLERA